MPVGDDSPQLRYQHSTMTFAAITVGALALASGAIARTIGTCPGGARQISYDDGNVYEICPGTTFTGSSFNSASGCLSTWDCLQQCNLEPRCRRSVYRDSDRSCRFMANNTVWSTDNRFDSVHFVKKVPKTPATNVGLGQWSSVIITPVIPVGAYVVPQYPSATNVMMFSSWGPTDFTSDSGVGTTQFSTYNFVNGAMSTRTVANTNHDMFCPGMSNLQDGRLLVSGGNNAAAVSFYDPSVDNFVSGAVMNIPRGYHTSATTSKGQVFVLGGSFTGGIGHKDGEYYDPSTNTWNLLPGVPVGPCITNDQSEGRADNHMWLLGWKNGSVFHAGPARTQHWIDTNGDGRIVNAGQRGQDDAMCGVHVMYDAVAGKIFSAGGAVNYDNTPALASAFVTTIGTPYTPSQVQQVADMMHPRGFANVVVLPDGKVLITGGLATQIIFDDDDSWLAPELWDPKTQKTTPMASAAIPRNYHSVSLLLADGRVLVGGSGLCDTPYGQSDAQCNRNIDHPDIEIYSPPYLFDVNNKAAVRPVIASVSASSDKSGRTVVVGGKLTVVLSNPDTPSFALLRMGSVTHSVNTDQRRIPLTSFTRSGNSFSIQLPNDAGVAIPGYYYLFAISAAGTPSVANTVRVVLK